MSKMQENKMILKKDLKINFTQNNPYSNEWTCTDDSYDCDWDSEIGFYSISLKGTGDTKEEALRNYLNQHDDLTEEEIEQFLSEYKNKKP